MESWALSVQHISSILLLLLLLLFTGCGYYYQWPDQGTGWDVGALSDQHKDFRGSCGSCYEVKCANVGFKDGEFYVTCYVACYMHHVHFSSRFTQQRVTWNAAHKRQEPAVLLCAVKRINHIGRLLAQHMVLPFMLFLSCRLRPVA
jgi:hypothetical protein